MLRRLWCRLFHYRGWYFYGESYDQPNGDRHIRKAFRCPRCQADRIVVEDFTFKAAPVFFSKVSDPTDWDYDPK